ncbi:MAG: cell envelope integrity protein TolA [Pseudomonadota bacterium]
MMAWLLKYEGYPSGVVVAVLLHALLIYILLPSKFNPDNLVKIEQPSYVTATVTKENPQRTRQLQELERKRQQEQQAKERRTREAAKVAEEQKKREQAQLEANKKEEQRKAEAQTQAKKQQEQAAAVEKEQQAARAAKETEEKQETARRAAERERLANEQAAREAADREAANQAAAQAAAQSQALSAENQLIAQYTQIIREIIESNWIQPPSTRNGMQVLINIRMTPVGDILSSVVVQSSGDPVFDRAALQAVNKAGRFPELNDLPPGVFERNFRDFNLMFSPEGLLR